MLENKKLRLKNIQLVNEKNEKQAKIIEEKKTEKKKKHQIPTFLKPISSLVALLKAQKFGAQEAKPLKYKAVGNINKLLTIFYFLLKNG